MNTTMLIVCLIALILIVLISVKFKVNIGIVAYAMAFLVGGFGLGIPARAIVTYFPVDLFFQLFAVTLFYGFSVANGTMQKIADFAVYWGRNKPALLPWIIFIVSFVICAIGCPPPGIGAALVALSVAIQKRTNMNYYLAVSIGTFGGMAGGFMPLGLFTTITKGLIIKVGGVEPVLAAGYVNKISLFMIIFEVLCAVAIYIWGKGYKTNKLEMDKPEPFNKKQKQTLAIIAGVLILIIVPAVLKLFIPFFKTFTNYISILSLACIGAILCSILKVADERQVIRNNIPWPLLVTIIGAVTFFGVVNEAGFTEFISGLFSPSMTGMIAALMFCFLAGALSFFVDSTGVVLPLFIPVAVQVAKGSPLVVLYMAALCMGAYAAGNCPISTGGAIMMSQVDDERREKLFFTAWIAAFATLGIALIVTLVGGLFPWT
ncbi:MAG: SLC13 family permease [Lachnospiraceae bacterium]|jgi:di/tricarboxylate transporter